MDKTNYIYIGPNVPRLGLMRNQLFLGNNPPALLQQLIAENPVFGSMFITTEKLSAAKASLRNPSSIESLAFKRLTEKAKQQIT